MGVITKNKPTDVALGMTPEEVIQHMGPPLSISANSAGKILKYKVSRSRTMPVAAGWDTYVFRFVDGRLVAFGDENEDP